MSEDLLVDFLALRENIPHYMREAAIKWLLNVKTDSSANGSSQFLVDFQVNYRKSIGFRNVYISQEVMRKSIIDKFDSNEIAQLLNHQTPTVQQYAPLKS